MDLFLILLVFASLAVYSSASASIENDVPNLRGYSSSEAMSYNFQDPFLLCKDECMQENKTYARERQKCIKRCKANYGYTPSTKEECMMGCRASDLPTTEKIACKNECRAEAKEDQFNRRT